MINKKTINKIIILILFLISFYIKPRTDEIFITERKDKTIDFYSEVTMILEK